MKKLAFVIKNIIFPACAIFTAICFVVLFMSKAASEKAALTLSSLSLFLLISALIAISNNIFKLEKTGLFLNSLIHMVLCVFSIIISLWLANLFGADYDLSIDKLVLVLAFCAFYLVIVFPSILIYTSIKKKMTQEKEYTPMFKNNK